MRTGGTDNTSSLPAAFEAAGLGAPNYRIECRSFFALAEIVAHSDLLAVVPWQLAAREAAAGRIVQLPLREALPAREICLFTRADVPLTPVAREFVEVLRAAIYLGNIKNWNDRAIAAINNGVSLPDKRITVVHRSDGSGTTWIYTNYLSKVSSEWKSKVGNDKSVAWPAGVGGKGNEGVASYVLRIKGAIGYVEYAYALQNHMASVKLQNQAGNYVDPTSENFQAAAANADWSNAPGFYMVLTDQPGASSWPITGATFILMHKKQAKPDVAKAVLSFFSWSYKNGDDMAAQLDYVPMPDSVVNLVEKTWSMEIKSTSGGMVWK